MSSQFGCRVVLTRFFSAACRTVESVDNPVAWAVVGNGNIKSFPKMEVVPCSHVRENYIS
eukprot:6177417-Pleurochrysis_carterae.AAC.3